MALVALSPEKVTPKKLIAGGIIVAQLGGMIMAPEATWNVNKTVVRTAGRVAGTILDDGVERLVCKTTSLLPDVNYNQDCVQNFFSDLGDREEAPAATQQVFQPETAAPAVSLAFNLNLVSEMEEQGYSCSDLKVVSAAEGYGAIKLLEEGGTPLEVGNKAYEQGAFGGITVNIGDTALVGACR